MRAANTHVPSTQRERLEAAYAEHVSEDALRRQRDLARVIHPCCGWRRSQGHNPLCSNAPKVAVA